MQPTKNNRQPKLIVDRSGFTLIEMMVVVVIVGILAALAYPSYLESVRKAKRAEAKTVLLQLMQQQERYYSQNTSYIVFSSASSNADEKRFKWFTGETAKTSAYEIVGTACADDTIQNCVKLTAKPGTDKVNAAYADEFCGDLVMTSAGVKSSSGTQKQCWR
jgi:type IV pilus assembly protein PilE